VNSAEIDFAATFERRKAIADRSIKEGNGNLGIRQGSVARDPTAGTPDLNDELRGLLWKDKEAASSSHPVRSDTRRAFPSFDEPAYKAPFDITVVADKVHAVISNAKVLSDAPGPGDLKHTVKFATTAKMSSYLVALAVGEFEYVEGQADGIPIRVWGTPGTKQV
jgi:aminopeptidase N/puromycin-sensitive aminopeptidase